jgi:hypothetical protein
MAYTLIASTTLSSNTAPITFSSIPQTFKDLVFLVNARGTAGTYDYFATYFNGDTGANYNGNLLFSSGSATPAAGGGSPSATPDNGNMVPRIPAVGINTSSFSNTKVYVPNYAGSGQKSYAVESLALQNTTSCYIAFQGSFWSSTAAITSVSFKPYSTGSFTTGSTFFLYGIK